MISESVVKEVTIDLLRKAVTTLPKDIKEALRRAYEMEEEPIAKMQLKNILDNIKLAESTSKPQVREAARELLKRIDPDPLTKYLLLAAFALLVFLVVWAYAGHH